MGGKGGMMPVLSLPSCRPLERVALLEIGPSDILLAQQSIKHSPHGGACTSKKIGGIKRVEDRQEKKHWCVFARPSDGNEGPPELSFAFRFT